MPRQLPMKKLMGLCSLLIAGFLLTQPVDSQTDFFKGKQIQIVGGPLDVKEFAKVPTANGPGTYDSICTYIAKGGDPENPVTASRLLDLTLHFLNSAEEMKNVYEASIEQYRQMATAPDAPFKNATINPLSGFGDRAFVLEAVTDAKTGYKSALIVFYKGRVGGSVGAWKKPDSSLETCKTVLRHILSKLP